MKVFYYCRIEDVGILFQNGKNRQRDKTLKYLCVGK